TSGRTNAKKSGFAFNVLFIGSSHNDIHPTGVWLLHHQTPRNSKHRLVKITAAGSIRHRKDRISISLTKRGRNIIANLVPAGREPGKIHWPGKCDFLAPGSATVT